MKSLSELWDTFKQSNICTMGVIEMEGERTEKIFLKILDKVFQNLMTTTPTSPKRYMDAWMYLPPKIHGCMDDKQAGSKTSKIISH